MRNKGISHNLSQLSDSPIRSQRSSRTPKKSEKVVEVTDGTVVEATQLTPFLVQCSPSSDSTYANNSITSAGNEEEEPIKCSKTTKHPSKNYSKINLYDKWVHARNQATDRKKEVENLHKELKKKKKKNDGTTKRCRKMQKL